MRSFLPLFLPFSLLFLGCDREESAPLRVIDDNSEHQISRLREDLGIELEDLRGRWLAAEGLLTEYQSTIKSLESSQESARTELDERLQRAEVTLTQLEADILEAAQRAQAAPPDDVLDRLQSAYEEIYCLHQRGADEEIEAVYRRYGFKNADEWGAAWHRAARSPAFEREVRARVERLCP